MTKTEEKSVYRLFNLPWYYFAAFTAAVLLVTYLGVLPGGMGGCFIFMIAMGTILSEIGEHTPIVRSYLGGGGHFCDDTRCGHRKRTVHHHCGHCGPAHCR